MKRVVTFLLLLSLFLGCYSVGIMGRAAALSDAGQSKMNNILKNITGATEFTVNQPVDNGIVVDMKDYGLSESNTPAENETAFDNAIAKVKSTGAWKLNIPKGTYAVAVTGKEAIKLSSLKNLLIEGNGSTLIFSSGSKLNDTPAYITMKKSQTIAIQNLSLDWDREAYPIFGIGKITAFNTTAGTVDFAFDDITLVDDMIFGGGRSWDPETNNRSETKGFAFPGGSSGISSMTKLSDHKLRLTYKNPANISSAVVGEYGQFWFRPTQLVNGFRMETNSHITFDNIHLHTVPYQAIFSNASEYFQIINSSVEPTPGTKERFSSYGGVEVHSVDGYFRMENCHLEGINDDNLHLSNHFFGGGVSGNPKIDDYTVALDHLTYWMHLNEVYEGATFGMRDAQFRDLGWKSKVVSFQWENYFTSDGNAPWRCTVTFEDPLPSNYKDTNQFWNMDKNTGNYIIRNNTFEGGLAHAMYLGLANGTVENNRVGNFAYPGLILNCLIRWDRWAIGTPINNVIIRGNTLKDCNKALRDPAAMFVGGGIDEQPSDYNPVSGRIAGNVLIENNTIESTPWAAFGTFSSKNIVIRNNSFINASTIAKKSGKPGGNVFITNADNVVFTGNTIYHGAVSYETGLYIDSATTKNIYAEDNSIQTYEKANGLYGEILVDTDTYGFEKTAGIWSNSSYKGYKGTVLGSSSTGAQIRWRPLLRKGCYEVLIYKMVVGANEAADEETKIEVVHKNGTYTTTMNCHSGTKGFVSLGVYEFDEGNTGYVQATRSSSSIRVSAVKFIRKDACTHGAKETVTKATCTTKGYTQRTCSTCGYTYKLAYTAALGHSHKYTNAGATHKISCSRCSYASSADHRYSNGVCICGVKDTSHNLYFDFKNSVADQARYTLPVYGGYNFDQETSPYWATGANGGAKNVSIDNSAGTMSVKVIEDPDSAGNYGPYIETTTTYGKYPWSGESYRDYYPLAYDPSGAEFIQIRFKLRDCTTAGTNSRVTARYETLTDSTYKVYENLSAKIDGDSTEYQIISIPVNTTFVSADLIPSLGFRFRNIKATDSSGGAVVIDYIFVGKRAELPDPVCVVAFKGADGEILETSVLLKGETATYSGKIPTKERDDSKHYTFAGWDKALNNVTKDLTVTAQFMGTDHLYIYEKNDEANHTAICDCGYSKDENHSYTYAATKKPTTSATGVLTGTCSVCSATESITLPKLNTTDYTKTTTKAPTCTAKGTDKYVWKTTTYGTFSFTASTAALGHTEVTDKAVAPTCIATGLTEGTHCSVCDVVITSQETVAALGHDYKAVVTAPTCTAKGYTTHTCSRCADTYKDTETAATGHSYTYVATKKPTTSATGVLTGTCSVCSGMETITLPKLNTTDYTKTTTKAPTCTAKGTDKYVWKTTTYGTFSFTASTKALGHTEVTDKAVAPTCIATGLTEGTHCSVCGAVITSQETVAALGHDYKAVVTAPTCTAKGYTTHTCSRCADTYKDTETAATGHSYTYVATKKPTTSATGVLTGTCSVCSATETITLPKLNTTDYTKTTTAAPTCTANGTDKYTWKTTTYGTFTFTASTAALGHSYTTKVTAPTCTAKGYTTHTCSRCSDSYKDAYTDATGHSYNSGSITTKPTCIATGIKTYTCTVCKATKTETVSAKGHTPVIDKEVAPTCTATGLTVGKHCSVCNEVLTAQEVIPATGHTEVIDKSVAPTCTATGLTEGKHCSVCNEVMTAQEVIPATGHSYTYEKIDGQTHKQGCENCEFSEIQDHIFVEGSCICGETEEKEVVLDPGIKIGHSLNLASDISVNFAVKTSLLTDYVNHRLVVEIPVYEGNIQTDTKTVTIEPVLNGGYYYYTLTGLTAVNMGDVVSAQLHMEKDGAEYVSKVDTYSVAQYAYAQMDKATMPHSLKALCADLLRYGKEAQIFKAYRLDSLVDAAMTDTHKSYLSDAESVTFNNVNEVPADLENPVISWAGKSLNLDSKVSIKYIFTLGTYAGKVEELTLKVNYVNHAGQPTEVILTNAELYNPEKGFYAFTFDGLLAAELRTVTEVAVYHGNTRLSHTLRYSPDTYGNNKKDQLLILCKALFAYSDTAKAYFAF